MNRYKDRTTFYSRALIRHILTDVEKFGLSGDQHFFIQFSLDSAGVQLPEKIRQAHRAQGSVIFAILAGEYENMVVHENGLKVDLGFDGVAETVFIPFSAISTFSDPSANFSLVLESEHEMRSVPFQIELAQTKEDKDNLIIFPKR